MGYAARVQPLTLLSAAVFPLATAIQIGLNVSSVRRHNRGIRVSLNGLTGIF